MLYKRAENWLFLRRLNYVHRAIILHWIPVFLNITIFKSDIPPLTTHKIDGNIESEDNVNFQ